MTKEEHLELNKWQREIIDKLKAAQQCSGSLHSKRLVIESAASLKFLGENLVGGTVELSDGEKINTGTFLADMGKLITLDSHTTEHLPMLIDILEDMLKTHDKLIAGLPDAN